MVPFNRLTRVSAADGGARARRPVVSGCSEASRMETRCLSGDVPICVQLGDMYANGRGVPRDLGRAARAYDRACSGGAVDVCNTLGEIVEQTGAIEGGITKAEQLYVKACEGGSSRGCLNLGLVAAGRDDLVRAFALYEKSCNGGWAAGCHHVAASYEQGEGVAKDVVKALAVYTQACDDEYIESCTRGGRPLPRGRGGGEERGCRPAALREGPADPHRVLQGGHRTDCTEADKLRTRVTLLAVAQQQNQAAAGADACHQIERAATSHDRHFARSQDIGDQKLTPIAKCARTSPPSRAATSRLIWNRLATTKPPTPAPLLNADVGQRLTVVPHRAGVREQPYPGLCESHRRRQRNT